MSQKELAKKMAEIIDSCCDDRSLNARYDELSKLAGEYLSIEEVKREMLGQLAKEYAAGDWETKRFCVKCRKGLTCSQVMYSDGRCPECGYKGTDACTIVETTEKAARWIRTAPWWQFWGKQGHWEFKDE